MTDSPSPQSVRLLSCPFCGGTPEIIQIDDGDNAGGSCVCCTSCQASGNVEFGCKENFVENWNRRASPADGVVVSLSSDDHAIIARCVERMPPLYMRGQHEGYYIHSDVASLIDMIAASPALAATSGGGEAVGIVGSMPGTSGFTMATFKANDVPIGTPLYATPTAPDADKLRLVADCAQTIMDWCDIVAKNPRAYASSRADANLRGPIFDDLRQALAALSPADAEGGAK